MTGTVYIVGTPIGNLQDMSPRAVETLRTVDFIAAEDTRVTLRLLNHFGIKKPLVSCYEHNIRERSLMVIDRVLNGESCAVVTDAGMPCISDPGEVLVEECHRRQVPLRAVPGPSAAVTALAVSGLPTSRFSFEGFLSVSKKARREHLEEIRDVRHTMIFYEAPHKLKNTLRDLYDTLGNRRISVVRELTKIYEQVLLCDLQQAIAYFEVTPPKGEFVLVVEGCPKTKEPSLTLEQAAELAQSLCAEGKSPSAAAREAAAQTGFSKSAVYRALLERSQQDVEQG